MKPVFRAALLGIWLLSGRVGAQQYDIRVFGVEDGLPGSTVKAIAQDSAGFLWVETDGGLCRFDGRVFKPWNLANGSPPEELNAAPSSMNAAWYLPLTPPDATLSEAVTGQKTKFTLHCRDGRFWRATDHGALLYPDNTAGGILLSLDQSNGLSSDDVNCLYEDRSGVIWLGTEQGGLCQFISESVQHYGLDGGQFSKPSSFALSPSGGVFLVGGKNGPLFISRKTGISGSSTGIALTGLLVIDDHRGIAGTDSGALAIEFNKPGLMGVGFGVLSLPGCQVNTALRAVDGSQWLGTVKGAFTRNNEQAPQPVGRDTLACTSFAEMGDSMLIGTHHGLFSVPLDNSAANWTPIIRAGTEDITCLTVDRADNIWIGTDNGGLVRYRNGSTQRWTTGQGLASDRIRQLLLDAYQNLWVGTDRGFNLLELDELQEEVIDIGYYGLEEGFPGIEAMPNACLLDTDSSLWFGTTRGTIHFDPRKVLEDPVAPRTLITDIKLFFEHPDWRPWSDTLSTEGLPLGLQLPYHENHLTFTFTGLSLAYPEKVRFQHKLEGRDADWSPITKEDHVTFSGLEPGEYAFLVKARNGSGVWNDEPARFTFVITPPFWATTGFRVSAGAALLLAFFGFQRVRDRQSRKARERLERIVATRTQELTEEKHRSDTLLLNILPETTAAELKERGSAQARSYTECTVLFSDFQGFTVLSEQFEATGIVTELDRFFRAFDRITDKFGTEKIKTIGDAYMCASGVPEPSPTHALDAVLMALEMLSVVDSINAIRVSEGHPAWPIRIGLNSGPLIAGVVGEKKFAYDVWGDTVNLASRMESSGAPGRVNVTGKVMRHVEAYVIAEARGKITIKGKGEIESWFIDRLRPEYSADQQGRTANARLMDIRNTLRSA